MMIHIIAYLGCLARSKKARARVIALHDIPEEHRENFKDKMKWLKSNFNVISLDDLCHSKNLSSDRLNVALTFDDGFKEYSTFVAPVLQQLSMPATFFVSSGGLGAGSDFAKKNLNRRSSGKFEFIDEGDIKGLARDELFTIGGHTKHHVNLGQQMSRTELENEIIQDKMDIEAAIGKTINFFAYPFGSVKDLHKESISIIKAAGYKTAFTIVPAFWSLEGDSYKMGRDSLSVIDTNDLWLAWLNGGYDALSKLKNALKQ